MSTTTALALLASSFLAAPDPGEPIAGLRLTRPPGWTRTDQANQTVVLVPPKVPAGQTCVVTVLASREYQGTEAQWHDEFLQLLGRQYKQAGAPRQSKVGAFRESVVQLDDDTGKRSYAAVYTTLSAGRGEWLVFEASTEALFNAHASAVRAMLAPGAGASGERLVVGPLSLVPPKGWVKGADPNGAVTLTAPDSTPLNACVLFIGVPEPVTIELQDAHAAMWRQIQTLGAPQGKQETGTTGKFIWSAADLKDANGNRAVFRLYSSVAGGKYARILLTAGTAALAKKHLDAVAAAVAGAELAGGEPPAGTVARGGVPAGNRVAIGSMEVVLPDRWQRRDDPNGWTVLSPPGINDPSECMVIVRTDHPLQGSWWATHHQIWMGSAAAMGMKPEETNDTPDGPGRFCWTFGRWRRDVAFAPSAHLYTTVVGDKVIAVHFLGTATSLFTQLTFPLQRMLREAVIHGVAEPKRAAIAEAFYCIRVRPVIGATTIVQKVHNDRLILFESGATDISMQHDAGLAGADYLWKVDPDLNANFYGRWRAVGDALHVTRENSTEIYTRDGANLRLGNDVWKPMPKLDGLRLEGRFGSKPLPGALPFHPWIELTRDGRFSLHGMFWSPILEGNPVAVPEDARGTYEIREWTIFLKSEKGFAQSQDFFILDEDLKNPGGIWMRSSLYQRE